MLDRASPAPASLLSQLPDIDVPETQEWLESLDAVTTSVGSERARYLLLRLNDHARERGVSIPGPRATDFINTIASDAEPAFPGDEDIERRIRRIIRWNAAIMVSRANRPGLGVGGHIATYQSAASLYEMGFNHFFRGKDHPGGGDQVFVQGHASPGIYARAFLEGRLTVGQLDGFRQELSHHGGGLPSYPHPRLMPDFWEFPTVSMGLGPLNAVYQARFNHYLTARGIRDTSEQDVWAFLGDGETDEPESLGAISLAAREGLDNLTFVINCNLQRLDGPVRGNGKIIQELESLFLGAGWNVIKVAWGREWDPLLAADSDGVLVQALNSTPDGQFQTYSVAPGSYVREHFFGRDPRLRRLVDHLTDDQISRLPRGGHDYRKVYAAFAAASEHAGQPTVILAHTVKGWTLPRSMEARNANHQMKKLSAAELLAFRDRLHLPLPDAAFDGPVPPYYHPGPESPEVRYLMERRRVLGGFLPHRRSSARPLQLPGESVYAALRRGSGAQSVATTMAFVRLFKDLMRDSEIGRRFVPIIPDEARTFGLDAIFPTAKIYSPSGQQYESVDREILLSYKESVSGQILHEGISEAGSVASFAAAATSYATHGEPMIPVYIFYSMFGFQRTGDANWAVSDQLGRGFMIGATAGRTTLNGEGLQHEDGHSLLLAATNPAVVAYDPAFAFEISHIVRDGLRRMYGPDAEDIWYYLTVYNEPYPQPAEPDGVDHRALLRGLYRYAPAPDQAYPGWPAVRLLASGVAVQWALQARDILAADHAVAAEVWSVTSWTELRRDALACDRWRLRHPGQKHRLPFVTSQLQGSVAPVVAVSDWMTAVPDQISRWVPADYASLGTDGFGRSDTRSALRRAFWVDAECIVVAALQQLAARGGVDGASVEQAARRYQLDDDGYYPQGEHWARGVTVGPKGAPGPPSPPTPADGQGPRRDQVMG